LVVRAVFADPFLDGVVLVIVEAVVDGATKLIACGGHCVDLCLSWRKTEIVPYRVVVAGLNANIVLGSCIEVHVDASLGIGQIAPHLYLWLLVVSHIEVEVGSRKSEVESLKSK
jgi:hypothetical protein